MTLRIKKIGQYWESIKPSMWVIGTRTHTPGLGREHRTEPTRKKARFAEKRARQTKERPGAGRDKVALTKLTT